MEATGAIRSRAALPAGPDMTIVQGLEAGWDADVAPEDRTTIEAVLVVCHELGCFHCARAADAPPGLPPPGLREYWVTAHAAPHYYYQVLAHFSGEVRFTLQRTSQLVGIDHYRIDPGLLEFGWDRANDAFALSVRVQMKSSPVPLSHRRLSFIAIDTTHLSAPVPAEGLQVKRTRDGTVISNSNSPRSKARRQAAGASPNNPDGSGGGATKKTLFGVW